MRSNRHPLSTIDVLWQVRELSSNGNGHTGSNWQSALEMVPGGSETILLVEDEDLVLRNAMRILRNKGYNVIAASNPRDAQRLYAEQTEPIDILVTDVVMPDMNGRQLAESLTRTTEDLCVLYMSGYPEEVIAEHGVLESGIAFLEKPFTSAQLAEKVRAVLDAH